jgi:hypothetical protein
MVRALAGIGRPSVFPSSAHSRALKGISKPATPYRIVRASGGGRRGGVHRLTPLIERGARSSESALGSRPNIFGLHRTAISRVQSSKTVTARAGINSATSSAVRESGFLPGTTVICANATWRPRLLSAGVPTLEHARESQTEKPVIKTCTSPRTRKDWGL